MKIYCSGSQMVCNKRNLITEQLNNFIRLNAELVISDQNYGDHELQQFLDDSAYKNVTVAFTRTMSEFEEWPHENIGKWPFREFIRRDYEHSINLTLVSTMADECDEAFLAWMESDIEVLLGILCFLSKDKICTIYDADYGIIIKISSLDDFSRYLAGKGILYKKDTIISSENTIRITDLLLHEELPDEIRKIIVSENKGTIHKCELKKAICKSKVSISKKREIIAKLAEEENLYSELVGLVRNWKRTSKKKENVHLLLMEAWEHSFWNANNDLYIAESWINQSNECDGDVALYLFERFYLDNGNVNDIPVGMYSDIGDAMYYLRCSPFDSDGGKLEVWEKKEGIAPSFHYEHRINLYLNHKEVYGFEFMRVADLINDCDPFEPVTYWPKNSNYMNNRD